jgi:hypothetical protein
LENAQTAKSLRKDAIRCRPLKRQACSAISKGHTNKYTKYIQSTSKRSIEGYVANRLHDVARNLRKYLATSIALVASSIAQKFSKFPIYWR